MMNSIMFEKYRARASRMLAALFFCIGTVCLPEAVSAQNGDGGLTVKRGDPDFRYPLNVPMSLSGNYGELRSNHFHGGIDFRVGGVVGAPVFAAESGYISRISVSPTGYGNALYITHPNGFVSVYGHLHRFSDKIRKYVREKQYEQEDFRLDLEPGPDVFPVERGEQIGNAGNTGSSGGPHLHFEIREAGNDLQTDVFARGYFSILDKRPPIFNKVAFYGFSDPYGVPETFPVQVTNPASVIPLPALSYVAIDAVDKQEGTNAKLAVSEYNVYLDTVLIYGLRIGEIPLEQSRYINSLIEYREKNRNGKSLIKSYVEPGNVLKDRIRYRNDGLIVLEDTLVHRLKIEVSDIYRNRAVRQYRIRRIDSLYAGMVPDSVSGVYMDWHLPNIYTTENLEVTLPPASLYRSIFFRADTAGKRIVPYAPVWKIHSPDVPLHREITVSMACSVPDSLASKALLARVGRGGKLYGAGGTFGEGRMVARIAAFGEYTVTLDRTRPSIVPGFKNNAVLKGDKLTFTIRDDLSGLASYRVEIDGNWVLAEFDAKNSRLTVPLPEAGIRRGSRHKLKIVVTDNRDNTAEVYRTFTW